MTKRKAEDELRRPQVKRSAPDTPARPAANDISNGWIHLPHHPPMRIDQLALCRLGLCPHCSFLNDVKIKHDLIYGVASYPRPAANVGEEEDDEDDGPSIREDNAAFEIICELEEANTALRAQLVEAKKQLDEKSTEIAALRKAAKKRMQCEVFREVKRAERGVSSADEIPLPMKIMRTEAFEGGGRKADEGVQKSDVDRHKAKRKGEKGTNKNAQRDTSPAEQSRSAAMKSETSPNIRLSKLPVVVVATPTVTNTADGGADSSSDDDRILNPRTKQAATASATRVVRELIPVIPVQRAEPRPLVRYAVRYHYTAFFDESTGYTEGIYTDLGTANAAADRIFKKEAVNWAQFKMTDHGIANDYNRRNGYDPGSAQKYQSTTGELHFVFDEDEGQGCVEVEKVWKSIEMDV